MNRAQKLTQTLDFQMPGSRVYRDIFSDPLDLRCFDLVNCAFTAAANGNESKLLWAVEEMTKLPPTGGVLAPVVRAMLREGDATPQSRTRAGWMAAVCRIVDRHMAPFDRQQILRGRNPKFDGSTRFRAARRSDLARLHGGVVDRVAGNTLLVSEWRGRQWMAEALDATRPGTTCDVALIARQVATHDWGGPLEAWLAIARSAAVEHNTGDLLRLCALAEYQGWGHEHLKETFRGLTRYHTANPEATGAHSLAAVAPAWIDKRIAEYRAIQRAEQQATLLRQQRERDARRHDEWVRQQMAEQRPAGGNAPDPYAYWKGPRQWVPSTHPTHPPGMC